MGHDLVVIGCKTKTMITMIMIIMFMVFVSMEVITMLPLPDDVSQLFLHTCIRC